MLPLLGGPSGWTAGGEGEYIIKQETGAIWLYPWEVDHLGILGLRSWRFVGWPGEGEVLIECFYICCQIGRCSLSVNLGGVHLLSSFQVRPFTGRSSRNSVYAEMTQVTMHISPDSPKYTELWCPASLSCLGNCTLLDTVFICHLDDNLTNL